MANQGSNHIYFVDPGIGEKNPNCPYSNYADGRDVGMFIVPPVGYTLVGFKLEPYNTTDQFYDGKIVAQFKKRSFFSVLKQNFWSIIAAIIIITLSSLIAITFVNNSKIQPEQQAKKALPEIEVTDTPIAVEEEIVQEEPLVVQEEPLKEVEEEPVMQETVEEEPVEIVKEEPVEVVKEEPIETVKEEPVKEEIVEEKPKEEVSKPSEAQPTPAEIKAQFKKEFWNLIHRKEKRMSQYGKLYREYKGKVKGSEFNYLWLTILESTSDFKVWSHKLDQIPADEIKKVHTISQLTKKIEEYE